MIIAMCGFISSGKDAAAEILVKHMEFKRESFAGSLKDATAAVFNWDRELLDGTTVESRLWREEVDPWWAERLGIPAFSPRYALQQIGTEVFREHFHDDIWLASLENKLQNTKENVVISDCRFPNEVKMVQRLGGKIIRVRRYEDPLWINMGRSASNPKDPFHNQALSEMTRLGIHSSEWAWLGSKLDDEVDNDGDLDDLTEKLINLVAIYLEPNAF